MSTDSPKTYYMPRFDKDTLRAVLSGPVPGREYVLGTYTITPKPGLLLAEAAARAAIVASVRSQRHYSHESREEWLLQAARVHKMSQDGFLHIAYPVELFGGNDGVSKLLATLTCGGEHDFVEEFWLHDFELPPSLLKRFAGPRYGIAGVRKLARVPEGPLIGVTVRPILAKNRFEEELARYREALVGGADYLADDILFSDAEGPWSFANRLKPIVNACREAENITGKPKFYIANLAVDEELLEPYAAMAKAAGVMALKLNGFYSGFGTLRALRTKTDLPLIATNIGVSLLTRAANTSGKKLGTGIAETVVSKLSRLCGADGVHLGSVDTGCFVVQSYDPAILALQIPIGGVEQSFPVIGDNINVANLWQNLRNFGEDTMIEASGGIMSYSGGPKAGAKILRELARRLASVEEARLAHETIMSLTARDDNLRSELDASGYKGAIDT